MSDNQKYCTECGVVFDQGRSPSRHKCPVCNQPDRNKNQWQLEIESRLKKLEDQPTNTDKEG